MERGRWKNKWNSLCEVPFSFEKNKIEFNPLHSRIKHEGDFS